MAITLKADVTVKAYREVMASASQARKDSMTNYIAGLGAGMGFANVELIVKKKPPIYL